MNQANAAVQQITDDGGLSEVKAYFKENLNDPNYEIVRFWPKRKMAESWKKREESLRYDISKEEAELKREKQKKTEPSVYDKALEEHLKTEPIEMCRIKVRGKNGFGALTLVDYLFRFEDGKASPVDESNTVTEIWARESYRPYFPD